MSKREWVHSPRFVSPHERWTTGDPWLAEVFLSDRGVWVWHVDDDNEWADEGEANTKDEATAAAESAMDAIMGLVKP